MEKVLVNDGRDVVLFWNKLLLMVRGRADMLFGGRQPRVLV